MTDVDRAPEARLVARASDPERSFVAREIAGETILVPVCERVADLNAIYTLNDVGSRIWQLVESPTAVDRVAQCISQEYEVSAERAAEDVAAFLGELEALGFVRFTGTPGHG